MRNLYELDRWREKSRHILDHYGSYGDDTCGVFVVPLGSHKFVCVASAGAGWDHVSISLPRRCPSWPEMDCLKRIFFKDDEVVMQLHVAASDHISFHPFCLHLWRPHDGSIPLPPKIFV